MAKRHQPIDKEVAQRAALDATCQELADALGIDPEFVQADYPGNRVSISAKQAARLVEALANL